MKLQETLAKVQGHLERLDDPTFDKLDFEWEGIQFHASAEEKPDGSGSVRLNATLGRLYFTVEDAAQRTMAIERVYATNRGIDGAYLINKKGEVLFNSVTLTDKQLTGSQLMGALTLILLESETHLRALRSHLKPLH
ncbi:hypothetical protein [Kordiimonas marina]|uniref:hypothetical protein n=1 Tax=Kordiimonas marina TaxID=2872312 RepID=UPI001FF1295E|nr:hypothetical protein [Kordiimonas marina]MCJ9429013.1 hypothetical protein [Kordiimonas marina]